MYCEAAKPDFRFQVSNPSSLIILQPRLHVPAPNPAFGPGEEGRPHEHDQQMDGDDLERQQVADMPAVCVIRRLPDR